MADEHAGNSDRQQDERAGGSAQQQQNNASTKHHGIQEEKRQVQPSELEFRSHKSVATKLTNSRRAKRGLGIMPKPSWRNR